MFELDPPYFVLDAWPFPDRAPRPAEFETLGANYIVARAGGDVALLLAPNTILEGGPPDDEDAYARLIGPAEAANADEIAAGPTRETVTFTADGGDDETVTLGGD